MATVINNPSTGNGDGSGGVMGIIVVLIVLVVVGAVFFIYVLPTMRDKGAPQDSKINIDVKLPTGTSNDTAPAGN